MKSGDFAGADLRAHGGGLRLAGLGAGTSRVRSGLCLSATLLVACGVSSTTASKQPREVSSEAAPAPAPAPAPEADSPPPLAAPEQSDAAEQEQRVPTGPEIVAIVCEETCQKMDKSCSPRAANFCRASCRDYVSAAERCPIEVEGALTCQRDAADFLLCSNIAAESCAPLFRTMKDCREGLIEPQERQEAKAVGEVIPSGWKRLPILGMGFSLLVPSDLELQEEGEHFRGSSKDEKGFTYTVESLRTGAQKVTSTRLLRWMTDYVGSDCQPGLRLHGRYESGEIVHVRFDTTCKDESRFRGIVHIGAEKGVVATVQLKPGQAEMDATDLESFIFSFKEERENAPPAPSAGAPE